MKPVLVLTNCPDRATAEQIAHALLERRQAACVNILAACQSIYRWQGQIESAEEIPLLIKTTSSCYNDLEATIQSLHPYTVPEIIALPIDGGLAAYLGWLVDETGGNT